MDFNNSKKNILVIGGSGFIGTPLIKRLLNAGYSVKNYDKKQSKDYPNLTILGDVNDRDFLLEQMKNMDIIYNLAAEHKDNVRPKSLYYKVNVDGARNVVYAAQKNNIKTIIFTSTVAVYGLNKKHPSEDSPLEPFNDYSKSKRQAEEIYNNWVREDKDRTLIIIRPTAIFGEENQGNVYNLIKQIVNDRFIMVGSGNNKKSLAYIENLAEFLIETLKLPQGKHIFNYADKPDMTMNELIDTIYSELGKKKPKINLPYSIGILGGLFFDLISKISGKTFPISAIRIKKFCASTVFPTKQLSKIGFTPPYTLKEGLKKIIKNYAHHNKI